MKTAVPGLVVVAAGVAFGLGVASAAPALSALVVAMVAGVVAANLGLLGSWAEPGIQIARTHLLKIGVVLLGFRLSLLDVLELGGPPGLLFILAISADSLSNCFMALSICFLPWPFLPD